MPLRPPARAASEPHSAPDAASTPTVARRLTVASTCPRSSRAGRCCTSALSGTMKNPPHAPSTTRTIAALANDARQPRTRWRRSPCRSRRSARARARSCRPRRRPATTLPSPIPTARHAVSAATRPSSRSMTDRPTSTSANCTSAPNAQKYAIPSAACPSVRSASSRRAPWPSPANGLSDTACHGGSRRRPLGTQQAGGEARAPTRPREHQADAPRRVGATRRGAADPRRLRE